MMTAGGAGNDDDDEEEEEDDDNDDDDNDGLLDITKYRDFLVLSSYFLDKIAGALQNPKHVLTFIKVDT